MLCALHSRPCMRRSWSRGFAPILRLRPLIWVFTPFLATQKLKIKKKNHENSEILLLTFSIIIPQKIKKKNSQIPWNIEKCDIYFFLSGTPSWLCRTLLTPGLEIRSPKWFQWAVNDNICHLPNYWDKLFHPTLRY